MGPGGLGIAAGWSLVRVSLQELWLNGSCHHDLMSETETQKLVETHNLLLSY